jgi:hypothetical protein
MTPAGVSRERARAATVQSTLALVELRAGLDGLGRVLGRLDAGERQRLAQLSTTDELPFGLLVRLWQAADVVLAPLDPLWAEQAGAYSIESLGVKLYGGILRKPTPTEFLTQSVSLFRLYYHPGDMHVVEAGGTRAVLRLVGFDPVSTLFCRRQTGGLRRAIELAGASQATVRHVRCSLEGDAFCEWELQWLAETPRPA